MAVLNVMSLPMLFPESSKALKRWSNLTAPGDVLEDKRSLAGDESIINPLTIVVRANREKKIGSIMV
tara:strand:- start:59 stop:259 length:201 start_codon:yes stop_codon:yes gene_type:complete